MSWFVLRMVNHCHIFTIVCSIQPHLPRDTEQEVCVAVCHSVRKKMEPNIADDRLHSSLATRHVAATHHVAATVATTDCTTSIIQSCRMVDVTNAIVNSLTSTSPSDISDLSSSLSFCSSDTQSTTDAKKDLRTQEMRVAAMLLFLKRYRDRHLTRHPWICDTDNPQGKQRIYLPIEAVRTHLFPSIERILNGETRKGDEQHTEKENKNEKKKEKKFEPPTFPIRVHSNATSMYCIFPSRVHFNRFRKRETEKKALTAALSQRCAAISALRNGHKIVVVDVEMNERRRRMVLEVGCSFVSIGADMNVDDAAHLLSMQQVSLSSSPLLPPLPPLQHQCQQRQQEPVQLPRREEADSCVTVSAVAPTALKSAMMYKSSTAVTMPTVPKGHVLLATIVPNGPVVLAPASASMAPLPPSPPLPDPVSQKMPTGGILHTTSFGTLPTASLSSTPDRDRYRLAPEEIRRMRVTTQHYWVDEHAHIVNKRYVKGCPTRFGFGHTQRLSMKAIRSLVSGDLEHVYCLVGHAVAGDIKVLSEAGLYSPPVVPSSPQASSDSSESALLDAASPFAEAPIVVDTQILNKTLVHPGPRINLERLCAHHGISTSNMHNAGNDAHYTALLMLQQLSASYIRPTDKSSTVSAMKSASLGLHLSPDCFVIGDNYNKATFRLSALRAASASSASTSSAVSAPKSV